MIWELQWKVELVDMPEFFSNSMDVAKIMQLYLQKEMQRQYFSEKHSMTLIPVILFRRQQKVGFDKHS
jgi:hypothetical protein